MTAEAQARYRQRNKAKEDAYRKANRDKINARRRELREAKSQRGDRSGKIHTVRIGMYFLCSDVLTSASREWLRVRDIENDNRRAKLIEFFMSDTFEVYCDVCECNPEVILEGLEISWSYADV